MVPPKALAPGRIVEHVRKNLRLLRERVGRRKKTRQMAQGGSLQKNTIKLQQKHQKLYNLDAEWKKETPLKKLYLKLCIIICLGIVNCKKEETIPYYKMMDASKEQLSVMTRAEYQQRTEVFAQCKKVIMKKGNKKSSS